MVDEIFDRTYQAGRAELHAGIDDAVRHVARAIMATFESVQRIEWSTPWAPRKQAKCH